MCSLPNNSPKGSETVVGNLLEDPELVKVLLNQISILVNTLTTANWESNYRQIHHILETYQSPSIFKFYLERVLNIALSVSLEAGHQDSSLIERLLKEELKYISNNLTHFETLSSLLQGYTRFENFDIIAFIRKFDCDLVLAFLILSRFQSLSSNSVKRFIQENSPKLLTDIKSKQFTGEFNWSLVIDHLLNTPFFPLVNRVLALDSLKAYRTEIEPINRFYQTISKMSFRDLLLEIGPERLLPEKLLPTLLQLKPSEINSSIALLLAEILIPGSQGLSKVDGGATALTHVNSLPEANARGAQLQACFRSMDKDQLFVIDWPEIFTGLKESLSECEKKNQQPSIISITQFLSSVDYKDQVLDVFLDRDWWFNKALLYILHSLDPQQGAYDLASLKHLTLCFDDDYEETNFANSKPLLKKSILRFKSVSKLELRVLGDISEQNQQQQNLLDQEKKLNIYLGQLFEHDYRVYPYYLVAASLDLEQSNSFAVDLRDSLFALLMDANNNSLLKIIQKFKQKDEQFAVDKLIDYYTRRTSVDAISKIVLLAKLTGLLDPLINKVLTLNLKLGLAFVVEATSFGYEYAPLFEQKLKDSKAKASIVQAIMEILEAKTTQDFEKSQQHSDNPHIVLSVRVVYYLLEKLKANKSLLDAERLKNLQLLLLTTYPRLINFGCGHDEAILANGENNNVFPISVEQEMKTYYSKMYNKEMEIKEIVDLLVRMKTSDEPHDQDVFACMIHSLLDEYRFFPEYPLTALASTSLLFGALLQKDLIQGTTLTVALNFIWESCNQPQDSHLFKFAIQSLYNFKSRLHEYPRYCKHLLECQSLSAHAKMYQIVKDAANGIPCRDNATNNSQSQLHEASASPSAKVLDESVPKYKSIAAEAMLNDAVQQEKPPENVSDKLLFFVNNSTEDNLNTKLAEVRDLLSENYYLWFASYLVSDRAMVEPNNHNMYARLVLLIHNRIFYEYVLHISLKEAENLIRHSKDTSTDRSKIKNLGSWIGKITLANDKPLKRNLIAIKYLLLESYNFNTLHIVLPFACKILDQCQYSKIFNYPNPWLVGILRVLVELYECADLKLTLKFEIEVLLNSFKLKVNDIEPSVLVRNHDCSPASLATLFGLPNDSTIVNDIARLNIDPLEKSNEIPPSHLQQLQVQLQQQQQPYYQLGQQTVPLNVPQGRTGVEEVSSGSLHGQSPTISGLDTSFSTLVGNTIFTQNPNLRRAFQASMSRAVRECAVPILTRVSEAVLTTTEALMKKDFAYEQDINKFTRSYQTLTQRLSHSMVLCSGRKLLSETVEATMIQLLSNQLNPNELPLADLGLAIQQNVDLCVDIVDKIAAGNISELINERMQKYVLAREQGSSKPYADEGIAEYSLKLPQPLGLKYDGLTPAQLKIYETFGTNGPNIAADINQPSQASHTPSIAQAGLSGTSEQQPKATVNPQAETLTPQQQLAFLQQEDVNAMVDRLFVMISQHCEKAILLLSETKETKLSDLPVDHPIMVSLTQALSLAQGNAMNFPELLLKSAQYVVNCLFTQSNENPMSSEIYVVVLDKLCEYSPSTAKDVTWWLVHSSDQRKFNLPVIYSLLKVQLIDPSRLDISIGRLIEESGNPVVVKFAATLLLKLFTSQDMRPISLISEFGLTLDALYKYKDDSSSEEHEAAKQARDNLISALETYEFPLLSNESGEHELYTQMGYIFAEWLKVLAHGNESDKLQTQFVAALLRSGILSEPMYFRSFFKASTEIAILSFATEHEVRSRTQRETYLAVDSLAILIVKIILSFEKTHSQDAINYLKKIISIIMLVLINDHETAKSVWNERAYFRLFSSILCSWNDASSLDETATTHLDTEFYLYIGETFRALQPIIYPGFTFAWISLVGHRMFLPRMLELPERKGYSIVTSLLCAILKFESVYSKDEFAQQDFISVIFKAINRLFVSISHDYPEFLVECHYHLITALPQDFVQLKNIVLSATPKNIPFIDPFTQGLKVERLPEINVPPVIAFKPADDLNKVGLKRPVDTYLRIPSPTLVKTIYNGLALNNPKQEGGFGYDTTLYNVKLINALVLHVGISAVADRPPNTTKGFNTKSAHVALLVDLMNLGSPEFKFHMINAIANQLRYPNSHTHWFIGIILHFFSSNSIWTAANDSYIIQEIIIRVLLERHIVSKPHPWGLTIVFTELVKNDDYGFFDLPVVKNAPLELKLIFEALDRNVKGSVTTSK